MSDTENFDGALYAPCFLMQKRESRLSLKYAKEFCPKEDSPASSNRSRPEKNGRKGEVKQSLSQGGGLLMLPAYPFSFFHKI